MKFAFSALESRFAPIVEHIKRKPKTYASSSLFVENGGTFEVRRVIIGIIGHTTYNAGVGGQVGRVPDVQGLTNSGSCAPAGAASLAKRVDAVGNAGYRGWKKGRG